MHAVRAFTVRNIQTERQHVIVRPREFFAVFTGDKEAERSEFLADVFIELLDVLVLKGSALG